MINLKEKLDIIIQKHKEIEKELSNQEKTNTDKLVKLNKEYSELNPLVESINEFYSCQDDINNLKELLNDKDIKIKEIAEVEFKEANHKIKLLENNLLKLLIPQDINDKKNSILEIRAGTGGDEASLFAADLFNM